MATATDYYECRHLGHAWEDIPVTRRPPFGVYIWLRCVRCTTERHDILPSVREGKLLSRNYIYPEGYKTSRDERPSIEELRVFQLKLNRKRQKKKS